MSNYSNRLRQFRHVKQGNDRIAILIPCLGIAIKIAKINPLKGLRALLIDPWRWSSDLTYVWTIFKMQLKTDSRIPHGCRYYLCRGVRNNWQELCFYKQTRHHLLQPTYFSFFGIANIQKLSGQQIRDDFHLFEHLFDITHFMFSGHHFDNPNNFCLDGQKLKFLDYGDQDVQQVINNYGDQIWNEFDPNWNFTIFNEKRDSDMIPKAD